MAYRNQKMTQDYPLKKDKAPAGQVQPADKPPESMRSDQLKPLNTVGSGQKNQIGRDVSLDCLVDTYDQARNAPEAPPMTSKAWYALRRTLTPWHFDELLAELIAKAPIYGVDEVILKIDSEEFTHGQPPLDWVQAYVPKLLEAKEALETIGVRYSLNPWITVGHCDRGRDATQQLPGLQTTIGHDGSIAKVTASPLCPVWRRHFEQIWTFYAQTQPSVIWVEDDIRTFNHDPVVYGIFDPLVLKRFSQRVGQQVTREQVVDALFQSGKPHAWRSLWLDMVGEIMVETAAFIAEVVHRTSPTTFLGLMSSGPRTHCIEGRHWQAFTSALANGKTLYSRPPLGNYQETSLRGFYFTADSIQLTRFCLPKNVIEQTEVENFPFSSYSNSAAFTFLKMAVSIASGVQGVTLNLFDHCGTPMEQESQLGEMLGVQKPMLNALADVAQRPGRIRGVRLLHHDQAGITQQLEVNQQWQSLIEDGQNLSEMLNTLGVATTYETEPVTAVSGQVLRAFKNSEIESMLGANQGLLLDGVAAQVLMERGFGEQIGLKSIKHPEPVFNQQRIAEELLDINSCGKPQMYMTCSLPGVNNVARCCPMEPAEQATVISRFVAPDTRPIEPAMIYYENSAGGRIAIHAWEYHSALGVGFANSYRKMQMQSAIQWLSRDKPALLIDGDGAYPLAIRKDLTNGDILMTLFNLSLDAWREIKFTFDSPHNNYTIQQLQENNRWHPIKAKTSIHKNSITTMMLTCQLTYDKPLCLLLTPKQ